MKHTKVQSKLSFWSSTLGDNLILLKPSIKKEPVCEPNVITDATVLQSSSSIKSNIHYSSGSQSVSSFFVPKKACSSSSSTLTSALSCTSLGLKRNLSMSQVSTPGKVPITETNGNKYVGFFL